MSHLLLNNYNIILYDNNGTYSDYSLNMRNWLSLDMLSPMTVTEDYIYIGLPHTFSSRFIYFATVNDQAATLSAEYYAGTSTGWRAVKNFADQTRSGAVTMAQHGFISWDLPTDWVKSQVDSLPELPYNSGSGDGYGYYWLRLKTSATLNASTSIRFLGSIWTSENYMKIRWPEVTNARYLPSGQTDWYELIEMSTADVVTDLNIQNIIDYELQAKDINELADLAALKSLINILTPMTSSETLREMRTEFKSLYDTALRKRLKSIDTNKDERIGGGEARPLTNTRILRG